MFMVRDFFCHKIKPQGNASCNIRKKYPIDDNKDRPPFVERVMSFMLGKTNTPFPSRFIDGVNNGEIKM